MIRRKPKVETILKDIEAEGFALSRRSLDCGGNAIEILYIQQLTDRASLMDFVIRPLSLCIGQRANTPSGLKARAVAQNVLYIDDYRLESDGEAASALILDGMTLILLPEDDEYIVANLKKVEHRAISDPMLEYTLRGPRDCFVETLDTNLSLIRYRNKDTKLRICQYKVGKRTKTSVAVFYIEDIANDKTVSLVKQRIQAIDVDGVADSGELEVYLQNSNLNLFPQMGVVERSDMAQHLLSEGKVLILLDGSSLAISAPKCFPEYFLSCDDRYDNMYFGLFMRMLRYIAFFIALYATSFYVSISEFHMDALPSRYVISLAEMRARVPFPPIVGALMLEFIVELLREALLRVPKQIGPAVGIVSAIVIGQAAISAGVFSPLLLMLASASLLASFVMPDFSLINPIRVLKFIAILCAGFLGFYGLILFSCVLLIRLVSIESFGIPYFTPFAPFNRYDFIRSFIFNISVSPYRTKYLKNKDNTRTKT